MDGYGLPIPQLNDGQESSGIEQVADKMFGLWRPWKTHEHYSTITLFGHTLEVTPDLFIMKMNKQRGDDGDKIFILYFDMAALALAEMDVTAREPEY